MTRMNNIHPRRRSHDNVHYRPKRVQLSELLKKSSPTPTPVRKIYVCEPYFTQMLEGDKNVEVRPNLPRYQDLSTDQLVEFCHRFSGDSFLARITRKRFSRHVVHMLRKETIKSCLPDHDPDDLQRAVNTYYSFGEGSYRHAFKQYGVVSFRFTRVDPDCVPVDTQPRVHYDKNSLCSIFAAVKEEKRLRRLIKKH